MTLPQIYPILDAETCTRRNLPLMQVAQAWSQAGIRLLQYRDKQASDADYLTNAKAIQSLFPPEATLIINDRAHLLPQTTWQGLHIGQTDLSPTRARHLIGPDKLLGLSTHTPQQVREANQQPVDYIAAGPVFATSTKPDADPAIGLPGIHRARTLTDKPLVAIGGITARTGREVLHAGADTIAVISALYPPANAPGQAILKAARDFLAAFK